MELLLVILQHSLLVVSEVVINLYVKNIYIVSPGSFNCSCSCLFTSCDVTGGDPYVAICVPIVNVTLSTTDDAQGTDLDPILRMSSDNDFLNINMLNSGTQYTFNVTTSNIIGSSSDETTGNIIYTMYVIIHKVIFKFPLKIFLLHQMFMKI